METVMDFLLLLYFFQGTVEFIMDKEQNFYFMEMNTRLQVSNTYQLFSLCQLTNIVLGFVWNNLNKLMNATKIPSCHNVFLVAVSRLWKKSFTQIFLV